MSHEDRQLQDYLDGRMAHSQRKAFEARLRDEPKLAATVEAYRRLGGSLRDGEETLPDAFYTRARQRFANASAEGQPAGFRFVSWETAGLAAAAVLVAAIFIPALREGSVEPASPVTTAQAPALETPAPVPAPAAPGKKESVRAEPTTTTRAEAGPEREQDEDAAILDQTDDRVARSRDDRSERLAMEKAPAEPGRRVAATPQARGFAGEQASGVVALPAGWLSRDAFRVVDDVREWQRSLGGVAGPALSRLSGPDPRSRLVLIGPPADCTGLVVVTGEEAVRINVPPPGPGDSSGGCALTLPSGPPVELTRSGR